MLFKDRADGGRKLLPKLAKYRNKPNVVVIGLPRGGVVTAYEIAKGLHAPLEVTCPRKIEAPFSSELAIGAVGEFYFSFGQTSDEEVIRLLSEPSGSSS